MPRGKRARGRGGKSRAPCASSRRSTTFYRGGGPAAGAAVGQGLEHSPKRRNAPNLCFVALPNRKTVTTFAGSALLCRHGRNPLLSPRNQTARSGGAAIAGKDAGARLARRGRG